MFCELVAYLLLRDTSHAPLTLRLRTDALTAAYTLSRESQSSPTPVFSFQWLIISKEWEAVLHSLSILRTFGEAHPLADAVCRALWDVLSSYCAALHIQTIYIPLPEAAFDVYFELFAFRRKSLDSSSPTSPVFNYVSFNRRIPSCVFSQGVLGSLAASHPPIFAPADCHLKFSD